MHKYHDYIRTLNQRFDAKLAEIAAIHNFDLGDEFEVALCEVFRAILPDRYGVCRGHVVDSEGNQAGDDIIVFDRQRFPTLLLRTRDEFSRKEWIPIEAVFAYIEAKHTLQIEGDGSSSLAHAVDQTTRVKRLCNTRREVAPGQIRPYFKLGLTSIIQVDIPYGYPSILNPCFTGIISRRVKQDASSPLLEDAALIGQLLAGREFPADLCPDLVVAGPNNLLLPVIVVSGTTIQNNLGSPFYVNDVKRPLSLPADGVAFGVGVCQLMWALDWIQLGTMNWADIVGDAFTTS